MEPIYKIGDVVLSKIKKLKKREISECLRFRFGKLFIRLRDTSSDWYGYCISSWAKLYWTEWQAGHYVPNGSCKYHTRNPINVNLQSFADNMMKHWNVIWYRDGLIAKIGIEKVEWLENTKNELKQRKEYELIEMINEFRKIVLGFTIIKSAKVQQEILDYIKKKEKKMWNVLYEDWHIDDSK